MSANDAESQTVRKDSNWRGESQNRKLKEGPEDKGA